MRLAALLFIAILGTGATALAQPPASPSSAPPSSSDGASSSGAAEAGRATEAASPGLPVSLDKIREALEHPPVAPIRGLNEQTAHFQVEVRERQKIEELLATLDFKSGPQIAGGLAAYEQWRMVRPPVDNPLAQPYAAFSNSELLTIAIENLMIKYLGGRLVDAVTTAERARAEQAARDEVARAMADFCMAQPNRGAGLSACSTSARLR